MAPPENEAGVVVAEEAVSAAGVGATAVEAAADQAGSIKASGPLSTVVILIAMQTEALPLVSKFQLSEDADPPFPKGVPWVRYYGIYEGLHINIIWFGKDSVLGVDNVGTVSASLVTYASILAFKPDLIINAGTAGGFKVKSRIIIELEEQAEARKPESASTLSVFSLGKQATCYAKGASIADVYLVSDVAFHDRRIPIPVFDQYGVGARKAFSTPNLSRELNLKVGKLSTGDSLDMSPHDEAAIMTNNAVVKDMEGAAVAYVADLFTVPAIFLKAVTDVVDGDKPTAEEFLENLVAVTAALDQAVSKVLGFLPGKCLSDL
ncbi:hypothetical protein Taro_011358 [Colocasia esculenta]|uniref:Nucleoside phosphorylase domain-containing protein n=1 Tax=Colocasia esculenta TaxID=4460 RepID=A0A843UAP3_COLES|nr:hypothetical protein [Colocasia esculenta]